MQLDLSFDSPEPLPILFVRHRRARRYVMRVLADGTVRVTVPRSGCKRDAQAFVDANRDWVAEQRANRAQRRVPAPAPLRPYIERFFRAKAERELPVRLRELAQAHGIEVTGVAIRDQRSRWGACSARGGITLNWRLIRVPAWVRDYVLLHELMHRRELNHSRRFWRLVEAVCPDHQRARRWLMTEGRRLWPDPA